MWEKIALYQIKNSNLCLLLLYLDKMKLKLPGLQQVHIQKYIDR